MTRSSQPNGTSNLEIAHSNQELIMEKSSGKKKRILLFGGVIVVIIIALVIAAIFILTSTDPEESNRLSREAPAIELQDILQGRFGAKSFNATWITGSHLLFRDIGGDVRIHDVIKQETETILPADTPVLASAFEYTLSADKRYLLIAHDYQKLYRHSYVAQYTIVNLETKGTTSLNAFGEVVLQLAIWGPVGNSIVFVTRNNIFYRPSMTSTTVRQITNDGLLGNVYNGVPDWVYEEEVFSSNKAMWVSPDGKKLAYGKFNDNFVSTMTIPVYGQPGALEFQYTRAVQIKYPKPGTRNPYVSLHVADLENSSPPVELETPKDLERDILCSVAWATKDTVTAVWMNRVQNEASIMAYNTNDPVSYDIIKNLNETSGWLELFTAPIISKDGSKLLLILSQDQGGNAGSFRHVTLYATQPNAVPQALTRGTFVVTEIIGWDEKRNLIYYQATTAEDPALQHVYSVSTETKQTNCISCGIRNSLKTECLYNSAEASKDFSHLVMKCDGPGVPEVSIFSVDNKTLNLWEGNDDVKELMKTKSTPKIKRFTFEVANGFKARVLLKVPPNLDTSGETKYPMVVNVYGGPDSYQVVERYNMDWGSYLAANKSIIYATIDGRGSGLKGDKILFSGYRRLGTVEIADQINVTKQIQQTIPYVDPMRTAIWGWSYGGYASGMALATDTEGVFKCGISVAPVTDWALYDSIYTERFMGLPTAKDNEVGYENAQLLNKQEGLRGKPYFLIHGTLDDNVHYQQSMLWAKVLEQSDILFRQMSYPDEDHGLAAVRPHLYHSLENFLDECFINNEDN